ncbi:MAG: helix-turn-helix domain-containing protein [Rhodospirillales bacterium]|nr:helix-turn-helix domain-containing protein [Rhodospirillales bacterium]
MNEQGNAPGMAGTMEGGARPTLFTLEEAAAWLHNAVKSAALRVAINQGRLSAIKVGRTLLIAKADLETFLEESRTCRAPPKAQGFACSDPTPATGPRSARASAITDGTSSGESMGSGANVRRALTTAQRLKKGKPHLPTSSQARNEAEGQAAHVIPIR